MIILGIDPGLANTGYGVINYEKCRAENIEYGSISTSHQEDFARRLFQIYSRLDQLIKKHRPAKVGIEKIYFAKNAKTAMQVGQAKGVAMLAAALNKVPIVELTPLQVKRSLSGYGKADKGQIQKMVKLLLKLKEIPRPSHAADALAIALTCAEFREEIRAR